MRKGLQFYTGFQASKCHTAWQTDFESCGTVNPPQLVWLGNKESASMHEKKNNKKFLREYL